jgi:ABC-type lipoprotein export system ATPase subunit
MITTIQTDKLTKHFGGQEVLRDISITFEQGKTYAISGVSGTGKSTLMHLLSGFDKPSAGAVFFNTKNIAHFSAAERAHFLNQSIGHVFQQPYLIRELSVLENIMTPGLIMGSSLLTARPRAQELLEAVGLAECADRRPSSLSGGQQQRVALARALFNQPAFLLADELTGNLDKETGRNIMSFLLKLQQQFHMGVIISTHDTYVAESMQHTFRLEQGELIAL